ncbi:MAG TPA: hypothetical protein VJB14_14305, partial [Planctomycetota bacterium]|nr:hypothetical protein [Planctomycetota bacterium]
MTESPPGPPPRASSLAGKIWIVAIFVIGSGLGLFASHWWSQPEHAVAGSFTQIHTALLRGPRDKAVRLVASKVTWDGREMTSDQFLAAYTIPSDPSALQVVPCASTPGHWVLA